MADAAPLMLRFLHVPQMGLRGELSQGQGAETFPQIIKYVHRGEGPHLSLPYVHTLRILLCMYLLHVCAYCVYSKSPTRAHP
jgi:hypothetical protein